jgi:hypothetical protein
MTFAMLVERQAELLGRGGDRRGSRRGRTPLSFIRFTTDEFEIEDARGRTSDAAVTNPDISSQA